MVDQTSKVMENTDFSIEDNSAYNILMPDDKTENNILIDVNVSFFFKLIFTCYNRNSYMQESNNIPVMMQLYDYDYPVEDLQLVLDLLKTWKLELLYQTLVGSKFKL